MNLLSALHQFPFSWSSGKGNGEEQMAVNPLSFAPSTELGAAWH